MQRYSQKDTQKLARVFLRRVGLLLLMGVTVAGSFGVWGVYQKERESHRMRTEHEHELSDLVSRRTALEKQLKELDTERGKETILREQYGLAGAGEGVIVIVDPSATQRVATSSPQGWLHKILPWW